MKFRSIRWFHNGREIDRNSTNRIDFEENLEKRSVSLNLKSVRIEDAGDYACEIENHLGNSRALLTLFIERWKKRKLFHCRKKNDFFSFLFEDAPKIQRDDPKEQKIAVDANRFFSAEIRCRISGIPLPNVSWTKVKKKSAEKKISFFCFSRKNEKLIFPSPKYRISFSQENSSALNSRFSNQVTALVEIINVTKSDHGIYQCRAENELGFDSMQINLTGLSKFYSLALTIRDAWKQFIVNDLSCFYYSTCFFSTELSLQFQCRMFDIGFYNKLIDSFTTIWWQHISSHKHRGNIFFTTKLSARKTNVGKFHCRNKTTMKTDRRLLVDTLIDCKWTELFQHVKLLFSILCLKIVGFLKMNLIHTAVSLEFDLTFLIEKKISSIFLKSGTFSIGNATWLEEKREIKIEENDARYDNVVNSIQW